MPGSLGSDHAAQGSPQLPLKSGCEGTLQQSPLFSNSPRVQQSSESGSQGDLNQPLQRAPTATTRSRRRRTRQSAITAVTACMIGLLLFSIKPSGTPAGQQYRRQLQQMSFMLQANYNPVAGRVNGLSDDLHAAEAPPKCVDLASNMFTCMLPPAWSGYHKASPYATCTQPWTVCFLWTF